MGAPTVAIVIGGVIVTLLVAMPKLIGRAVRREVKDATEPLRDEVAGMKFQLMANGGSTLRDAVNRIEMNQREQFARHDERLRHLEDK